MPWADFEWAPPAPESAVPSAFAEQFIASMPSRYAFLFDGRAIRRHAAIAFRRGDRLALVELWRALPDGSAAFCVVAEDRPGLLSAIAAALVLHRLDVITALVFSRSLPTGGSEAVDIVWVRRADATDAAAIAAEEAQSIGQVLGAILAGSISVEQIASQAPAQAAPLAPTPSDAARSAHLPPSASPSASSASPSTPPSAPADSAPSPANGSAPSAVAEGVVVRFDPDAPGATATLVVEAPDRPAMLLTITFELFQHGAQIVRSLVRTAGGRAHNVFELTEFSGAPLSDERKEQVRAAVCAALALTERPAAAAGLPPGVD